MGIGDAIMFVSCFAGMMLALPALMIFLGMTFTDTSYATAERLHRGFIRPLMVGAVAVAVVAVPASILLSAGSVFQLVGFILWLMLLVWAFTGMAGLARMIGGRMGAMADRGASPFVETIVGAFVLSFAIAFPLIGWLLILPIGLVAGLGATILSSRERRQPDEIDMQPMEQVA